MYSVLVAVGSALLAILNFLGIMAIGVMLGG